METIPGFSQSFPPPPPPPPPPQRSRTGLWIGLGIGAVVLCLCCALVVGVYIFRQDIPGISSLFPSPMPPGLSYTSPGAGISLTYPATWLYSESGDAATGYAILLASSADILNTSNAPQTGAAMVILTNALQPSDLSFTLNAGSMGDVVAYIATSDFTNMGQGQNLHTFTLSGFPAASGVYTMTNANSSPAALYIIAVLRNSEIIVIISVCPQAEWSQHQPSFDSIVNSMTIVTP
jgi:hypothetical protein